MPIEFFRSLLGAGAFPILAGPFVGLSIEFFHDFLEACPLPWLQREEFEAHTGAATPADHRLPDREWPLAAWRINAEFERSAWKDVDRTEDAASS